MNVTMKRFVPASFVLVGLLSACAPNPYVLPDRVYGVYPPPAYNPPPAAYQPPPPVQAPVVRTVPLPAERAPAVEMFKPSPIAPYAPQVAPRPVPPAAQAPSAPAQMPPLAAPAAASPAAQPEVHYHSSAAVKSLVKQADAEAAQGKAATAASTLERALRIESDNPDLWMKLSALYERQGNHQQAASMADKAAYYRESLH